MKLNLFTKAAVIGVVGFLLALVFYQFSSDVLKKASSSRFIKVKDYAFSNVTAFANVDSIEVYATHTAVIIDSIKTQNGKMEFASDDKLKDIAIKIKNHVLTVTVAPQSKQKAIHFVLPKSVQKVKIATTSGDIDVEHQNLQSLSISATSGDINLDEVISVESMIQSVSGDINWKGRSHQAFIQTVSGDLKFSLMQPFNGKIKTQTVSGEVVVPEGLKNGDDLIEIKTVSGNIRVKNSND